jgi:hypothetical protein
VTPLELVDAHLRLDPTVMPAVREQEVPVVPA